MSIRISASTGQFKYTANDLTKVSASQWTVMGWFRIVTDRNNYSTFLWWWQSTQNAGLQTGSDGTTLIIFDNSVETTIRALTVNRWYHLALARSGATARCYIDGVDAGGITSWPTATPTEFWIGNNPGPEWLNGNAEAVKVYKRFMSPADVMAEMRYSEPVSLDGLYEAWTLVHSSDLTGTQGRKLTKAGSPTTAGPPPISYGEPWKVRPCYKRAAAAPGGTTYPGWIQSGGWW